MQKYAKEEKTVQCTVCKSSEQIHSKTHPASWNTFGIFQQQWPLSQNVSWIFKMEDPVNQNTPSIVHMSNPDTDSWQRGTHTHTHLIFSAMGRAKHHHLQLLQWKKTEGSALHLQRNSGDYMTPTQKIQYYGQISQNDHWTIHLYCLTPCWFPQYRYFNDPPNKWTWFTLKKMNPVTGQKTPQRQTAGTWKDPSIESNGTWYVINDKWQVI